MHSIRFGYVSLPQIYSCISIQHQNLRTRCNNTGLILLMHVYKLEIQVFASIHTYVGNRDDPITCLWRYSVWAELQR